jgi:thioredoxin 1
MNANTPPFQPTTPALMVACLCAQWCRTCDEYKPLFAQLQADYPQAHFRWVDIEDEADLVDPIEVDNFPTLLIATEGRAQFFGFVTPHLETLRRLIQAQLKAADSMAQPPEVQALVQRLEA